MVTDRGLYRFLTYEERKNSKRYKEEFAFHKDVGHTTDKCVALKDEIERLIRGGHYKEFIDEQYAANREEQP